MEDKLIESSNKIISKHIFEVDIQEVWDLLNDFEVITKFLFGDSGLKFQMIKEETPDKPGAEFILSSQAFTFLIKCTDLITEPHFKKVTYYAMSEKEEYFLNHSYSYTLISNTLDVSTTFIWELEFEHSTDEMMTYKALEEYKQSRIICLKKWSDYLTKKKKKITQYESILINCCRKEIWEAVTNWTTLRIISPLLADEVQHIGDKTEVGSLLKLTYNTTRKVKCYFKVKKVNNEIDSQSWEYSIELFKSLPKIPYQKIKFEIIYLDIDVCFLIFEHEYEERLNSNMVRNVSNEKKIILKAIKNYLEK